MNTTNMNGPYRTCFKPAIAIGLGLMLHVSNPCFRAKTSKRDWYELSRKKKEMGVYPCLIQFKLVFECQTTMNFGTMKDGSHMINKLSIINRFT